MKKCPLFPFLLFLAITTPAFAQSDAGTPAVDEIAALKQKAQAGDPEAEQTLGARYEAGQGVPKDMKMAISWYEKAAVTDRNAQCNLGLIYYTGRGVTQDYGKALPWFQKAAANGNDNAQNLLAGMYENGQGTAKNMSQAVSWYVQSGNNDNTNAQFRLGQLYEEGKLVQRDYKKAVGWYEKAARLESHAQFRLGQIYLKGEDEVDKDTAKALDLIQKSANQQYEAAENQLGEMYENGWGVKKSKGDALKWYQLAAKHGSQEAKANLARLQGGK